MYFFDGNIGYMGLNGIFGSDSGTKHVTLKYQRDKLLYDIENYAYIEGHKLPDEAEDAKHLTADIGDEGNVDRATRILGLVHAAAVELLYPMTKRAAVEEVIDDRLWEPEEYRIELDVPAQMSQTTVHLIAKWVHEWMVCRVLADWLSITNPEAAGNWLQKAQQAEEEIEKAKNSRCGGTTIRPAQPL